MSVLTRLDARDRALFLKLSLVEQSSIIIRRLWRLITHLGGVMCTTAAAVFPMRTEGTTGVAARDAFATLLISHVIVQLVKRTVGRPRPSRTMVCTTLIQEPDRFSFPSGHAAAAMSIAFAYSVAFPSLATVLIPLAVLVGMSRVVLGVHYPGDVLTGQLIAVLTAVPIVFR
ncbi:MAG TPA: phosphatase PAP2 family protein [Gemmatimonadaceae bacterium]|jgi:undecaprenyl-diphosphatase|nr:phosphatase PAP2 family protein [Gemmatimonadaceae bacterium]